MASTVLVKDVLYRAGVLLQDVVPQFVHYPEHEMVDFLNDAQVAVTKFLPAACSRLDAIKLKVGSRQSIDTIAAVDCKPGDGSTPAVPIYGNQLLDIARNMGIDGLTAGRAIRGISRKDMDGQNPSWHTAANAAGVITLFMYDPVTPRYFYVFPPVPSSPVVWVEAAYNAQPLKIPNTGTVGSELYLIGGGSTTTISVADEYIDDLVNYTVARANMKDVEWADGNKAVMFTNMFLGSLNAKVAALTGSNPNLKQLPFAPEPIGQAK